MSWYEHILICWENGTVIGFSDIEKIKEIASNYVMMYKKYDEEMDVIFDEERQSKLKKENLTDEFYKKYRELDDKRISGTSLNILEDISSGKSYFEGNKGGIWICGCIANNTTTWMVMDELTTFFKELIDKNHLHGNIIGFGESEQSGEAKTYIFDKNIMGSRELEKGEKWKWGLLS